MIIASFDTDFRPDTWVNRSIFEVDRWSTFCLRNFSRFEILRTFYFKISPIFCNDSFNYWVGRSINLLVMYLRAHSLDRSWKFLAFVRQIFGSFWKTRLDRCARVRVNPVAWTADYKRGHGMDNFGFSTIFFILCSLTARVSN